MDILLEAGLSTEALIIILVCIIPVAFLIIMAIINTIRLTKKRKAARLEALKDQPKDLEQQKVFYEAYGSLENIKSIRKEARRVIVKVKDLDKVNLEKLPELGATGVLVVADEVRASYSDRADYVYNLIKIESEEK
jgi:phosphotransferase system IIB component